MSLSKSQKISLFEIIDTPYTGNVDAMYGKYGLSALTYEVSDDGKVQLKILSRLSELDADEEIVLVEYIDKWQSLGTKPYQIDGGTASVNGYSYAASDEWAVIQRRVKNLIPVRHYWETVLQSAAGETMSVKTIR